MRVIVESMTHRCVLDLPPTSREVSVRGFRICADMISVVRLDRADATKGVPATVCVSNPSERTE